nr:hypothetical protein CFP56_50233 [Quercus suber]
MGLSPLLKEVPSGIQHLRNLKVLGIVDLPKELEESLDPEQGSHYWIVEHVPAIYLHHKVRTGYYGYDTHILRSKHLMLSRVETANKNDDHDENDSNSINVLVEKAASPSTHSLPLLLSVVTGLTGISVKILFLWPNIIEVGRDGDDLYFSVGIASASFPIDNFYECPQCGCGLNCGSQQVEWHDYMYAILLLITESEKRRVLERLVKTMKLALLIIFFLEKLFMKF